MKKPACASQDDKSKQMETNDRIKIDYSYLDELDNVSDHLNLDYILYNIILDTIPILLFKDTATKNVHQ